MKALKVADISSPVVKVSERRKVIDHCHCEIGGIIFYLSLSKSDALNPPLHFAIVQFVE